MSVRDDFRSGRDDGRARLIIIGSRKVLGEVIALSKTNAVRVVSMRELAD